MKASIIKKVTILSLLLACICSIQVTYATKGILYRDKSGEDRIEIYEKDQSKRYKYLTTLLDNAGDPDSELEEVMKVKSGESRDYGRYRYAFIEPIGIEDPAYRYIFGYPANNKTGKDALISISDYLAGNLKFTYGGHINIYDQIESIKYRSTKCLGLTWIGRQLLDRTNTIYRVVLEENITRDTINHMYIEYLDKDNKWKVADFTILGVRGYTDSNGKIIRETTRKQRIDSLNELASHRRPIVSGKKGDIVLRTHSHGILHGEFLYNIKPAVSISII